MQLTPGDHAMTTRRTTDNGETGFATGSRNRSNALDAFMTTRFQFDPMLDRLKALSDDHFETNPDEINWGDVGTLNHYASLLRRITDAAFKEGEHAA
jgi:hypothetical protein